MDLREFLGGVHGLAGPVEVLDTHPVRVEITAIGITAARESVVRIGPTTGGVLADMVFHRLAGMGGHGRRVGVRLYRGRDGLE